jgi:hypothetical protein
MHAFFFAYTCTPIPQTKQRNTVAQIDRSIISQTTARRTAPTNRRRLAAGLLHQTVDAVGDEREDDEENDDDYGDDVVFLHFGGVEGVFVAERMWICWRCGAVKMCFAVRKLDD